MKTKTKNVIHTPSLSLICLTDRKERTLESQREGKNTVSGQSDFPYLNCLPQNGGCGPDIHIYSLNNSGEII
jgi:hypothetical protein